MAARNDITGDNIASRANTDTYETNYESIFGKKEKRKTVVLDINEAANSETTESTDETDDSQ